MAVVVYGLLVVRRVVVVSGWIVVRRVAALSAAVVLEAVVILADVVVRRVVGVVPLCPEEVADVLTVEVLFDVVVAADVRLVTVTAMNESVVGVGLSAVPLLFMRVVVTECAVSSETASAVVPFTGLLPLSE